MSLLGFGVLWMISPIITLAIIIGLLIERDKDKRLIQSLKEGKEPEIKQVRRDVYTMGYGCWPEERKEITVRKDKKVKIISGSIDAEVMTESKDIKIVSESKDVKIVSESKDAKIVSENKDTKIVSENKDAKIASENREVEIASENKEVKAVTENKVLKIEDTKAYKDMAVVTDQEEKKVKEKIWNRNGMGTMALILGIVFVVLAGVIFATTTWRIMADSYKVLLVFGCSVLFFGASFWVERVFGIRKTGNAFYILGSIFLFLSILAAAYFQLLGSTFVLMDRNRWKVLWVGSLVLEVAFLAGIKRFHERIYTQASLWGMSVSMLFMAKALQISWKDFISLMTLYAFGLVLAGLWAGKRGSEEREKKEPGFWELLSGELPLFGCMHFWVFSTCTMIEVLLVLTAMLSPSLLGGAALASVILGMKRLAQERGKKVYLFVYAFSASVLCIYAVELWENGWMPSEGILLIGLCIMAMWDIWKKDVLELPVLFLGGGTQLYLYLEEGTGAWWVVYTISLAVYLFRYRRSKQWRKPALSASAGLLAIAFWKQSLVVWPDWIELECYLLPIVLLLWAMGEIWGRNEGMRIVQRVSYMFCLGTLAWDALSGGLVVDALITEVCCLIAFILGQIKKDVWWVRFSGGLMLGIALFMTKDFWMSISWWIYLLAAGLGLILFAAVSEKKKQAGENESGEKVGFDR